MDYQTMYAQKLRTAEEAVRIVKDGDWVDYSETCSFPQALDAALARRSGELHDVKIRNAISMVPVQTVENDAHGAFTYNLWHCSGLDRKYIDQGRAYHIPMLFRHNGSYYRKGYAPVNVAMITVAPMDKNGNFSYGLTNCTMQEILDAAEHIVLEVNPSMPTIAGLANDHINIRDVDFVVESEIPVPTVKSPSATDIDRKIASYIFPYVTSGCTLQLGIGGIPNSIGSMIAESDVKDLGMHTELMSDGYLDLYLAGKITNAKKKLNRGKGVFSICNGSRKLYDFLDHNDAVLSAPMAYVNSPATIRELDDFISINGCIAVDLHRGGPLRPGELRVRRPAADQRHRRPGGLHHRRSGGRTRQGLPRHARDLYGQNGNHAFQHPPALYKRRHHHHTADPGAEHRDGIRDCKSAGKDHLAAGGSADRHCASGFPR